MRRNGILGNLGKWILPVVLLCLVYACGCKQGGEEEIGAVPDREEIRPEAVPREERPVESRPAREVMVEDVIPDVGGGAPSAFDADEYTAVLDVTEKMELHQKGDFRVWIGIEDYMPEDDLSMSRRTTSFPADEGNYARITPYAPNFRIEPEESQVMRIVPSGSSVLFTIIPEKKGEFKISAKIELFDNPYFEGVPIPKTTNIVSVVVTVDPIVNVMDRLGQLGTVLWDNFLKFWGAIVALIFGALLFVTRKFIKKKTGFMGDGVESGSQDGGSEAAPSEEMGDTDAGGEEEEEDPAGEEEGEVDYFDVGEGEDQ